MVAFHLNDASLDTPASPPAHLHLPDAEGAGVTLTYDDIIDSLMILVDETPGARVVGPVNRYASLLLNERDEVVGAMVDAFLTHAVHERPELQAIAGYMRLGSRPHGDTARFRTDRPERSAQPDEAWRDAAVRAVRELFAITGGYRE
ncbi:MAG TPA: hypothetical protein VGR22_12240 [Thermomicrobiales bacterium]|nr:hypothetical protein [Thermomicrobiales bacterium]